MLGLRQASPSFGLNNRTADGKLPAAGWRRRAAVLLTWCAWLYLAAVLMICVLLHATADHWWPGTLLMFGPRWVWALPLAVLAPAALAIRPRVLWHLLAALVLVVGPVMGFRLPWGRLLAEETGGPGVRVLTCNTHGGRLDARALAELIAETRPDVVALQEWSGENEAAVFGRGEWFVRTDNPLGLASRYPIRGAEALGYHELGGKGSVVRYELETPGGTLHFFNVHLASAREGLEAVLQTRWRGIPAVRANTALRWHESEVVSRWAGEVDGPVLLAGDFNMPTVSAIYRRHWGHYANAFSAAGLGTGYTKFTPRSGIRIDHVLAGPGWRCRRCWVGPDVGSDHRPVLADLEWAGAAD